MKRSRICVAILFGYVILFLHFHELDAITAEEQKQIELATSAVQSLAKAMQAAKFVSWIAQVGSVLGPAMMAVSAVINIVFSFLGLESPEMRFMKAEFQNLNDRLDSFSQQFQEVKNKIDWSSVQMSYGKVEANIRSLAIHRRKITDAKTAAETEDAGKNFVHMYELNYAGDSEILYNAMTSDSMLSANIFEASAVYTDQHPELTGEFMKGSLQLLIESYQIQATYIYLKYNNSEADEYQAELSTQKMNQAMSKANETYTRLQSRYQQQSMEDLKRMASMNLELSHDQFADLFYNYISSKFVDRRWFVAAYNPVKTYEKHYIFNSPEVSVPLFAGRNMVLTSVPMEPRKSWSIANANKALDFGEFKRSSRDGAYEVWLHIDSRNKAANYPVQDCAIVKQEESLKYRCNDGHCVYAKKSVVWCNDPACWVWGRHYYDIVVFG